MKTRRIILISICCLAIIGYVLYAMEVFPGITGSDGEPDILEQDLAKQDETEKIIEKERMEGNEERITKDELVLLISGSTLHFDNVQGEYALASHRGNNTATEEVSYAIDMVDLKGMKYSKGNNEEYITISYGENEENLSIDEKEKTFRIVNWPPDDNEEDLATLSQSELLEKGFGIDLRIHSFFVLNDVVNSVFARSMENYADWEFEETTFLDMPSFEIKGIDSNYENGDKFEMVVDKNTGIVLAYNLFNKNNEEMTSLTTDDIQINKGIDEAIFEPNLAGYEEVGIPSYVPEKYRPKDKEDD